MRTVRVATTYWCCGEKTVAANLRQALDMADLAGRDRADIFCLPELFRFSGKPHLKSRWSRRAESVPGPTTDALAAKAREYGMYVICPVLERRDNRLYNSAALIDRKGQVTGVYHKYVPTIGELEEGVLPGTQVEALATDFGKIGIAICFDLNFPDIQEQWRRLKADIIFWPSMFEGGALLRRWARYSQSYVVSATHGENARILDKTGDTLGLARWRQPFVAVNLNLDRGAYHWDTTHDKVSAIETKYGPNIQVEWLTPEGWILLTSQKRGLRLRRIEREFGLEPMVDYLARAYVERCRIAQDTCGEADR